MLKELKKLTMCAQCTTSGYPRFSPVCFKKHQASLKCHEERADCGDYRPSYTGDRRVVSPAGKP